VLAVDQPYMVHDFICTARHAIFVLCPVLFGPQFAGLQANGTVRGPIAWEPGLGTRIAVLDRQAAPGAGPWMPPAGGPPRPAGGPRPIERPAAALRWFSAEAFFTFHFMNAFEQDGRIHIDQVRYPALPGQGFPVLPSLWRLSLNLADGSTSERQLDDRRCEFPRIDARRAGLPNRYGWLPVKTAAGGDTVFPAIARYDLQRGEVAVHDFGAGQEVDEPVFIPRPNGPLGSSAEGDGWLLTYVYDRATDQSRAVLLDAIDIAAAPIAEITLPRRVPHGLHGNWVAA
jgi:carotenoid cleavage dioxygenase